HWQRSFRGRKEPVCFVCFVCFVGFVLSALTPQRRFVIGWGCEQRWVTRADGATAGFGFRVPGSGFSGAGARIWVLGSGASPRRSESRKAHVIHVFHCIHVFHVFHNHTGAPICGWLPGCATIVCTSGWDGRRFRVPGSGFRVFGSRG